MRAIVCGLLIAVGCGCADAQTAPAEQAPPQTQDAVVAEVAGRKITMKELDERWQSFDPGERARVTQLLYQNRRNVLDQMIGELLIEEAAKKAGVAADEFTRQETAKRLKPVSDTDVKQFFEENKDRAQGRTYEQLAPQIETFLTSNRQQQARAQLIDDLKNASSGARVMLEPPRLDVQVDGDDPSLGPPNAAVTLVEFSDYQ
jgi:protein-disulfide isomerase